MERYRHFGLAPYMFAYYASEASDEKIRQDIETYLQYLPVTKVYVENHRGLTDIPVSRLKEIRRILEGYGIAVSGGITSTGLVNDIQKPSLFDTFCYTDPAHREEYLRIVREAAEAFDEIILDDYFFTSCRCELCIRAKGARTWKQFRQEQMNQFSEEIVRAAKEVNPKVNFIIKYPNWYESHPANGYNPRLQKDIFDMIYIGTESREPFYCAQHLQRYLSYSVVRLIENTAPGKNGGAWIDLGGASDNLNRFLEQAVFSILAGAKELTLFNFPEVLESPVLGALDMVLRRADRFLDHASKPAGLAVYEPFEGEGEDQLSSYLGMCGLALELLPDFPADADSVLLTEHSAGDPEIMEKLEAFVRSGGQAVVTTGFVRAVYERGIREMTSVRLTGRHVTGSEYMMDLYNFDYSHISYAKGSEPVMIEALDYKTNATWPDLLLLSGENNFPILTEDLYGNGRLLILNVPDNFADLYKLPMEVIGKINKQLSFREPCYVQAVPKVSLIRYDNGTIALYSFRPMLADVYLILRGEGRKLRNLETGEEILAGVPLPVSMKRGDSALTREEEPEYGVRIRLYPGEAKFFKIES